jgi:hypothetical protein
MHEIALQRVLEVVRNFDESGGASLSLSLTIWATREDWTPKL